MEKYESPNQIKLNLENKIKAIFHRDKVRVMDVIIGNRLIKEWVKLTKYKSDDDYLCDDFIIDDCPKWQIK